MRRDERPHNTDIQKHKRREMHPCTTECSKCGCCVLQCYVDSLTQIFGSVVIDVQSNMSLAVISDIKNFLLIFLLLLLCSTICQLCICHSALWVWGTDQWDQLFKTLGSGAVLEVLRQNLNQRDGFLFGESLKLLRVKRISIGSTHHGICVL
jgi:hypothetical protein